MKQKVKKVTKIMMALIITCSILLVSLIGLTVAYFTDNKSYTGTLEFGTIQLDVSGSSINGENLTFTSSRSSDTATWTGKFMPGDTITMSFNVALKGGENPSEPAYYLVSITDSNNIFESGFYYSTTGNVVTASTADNHKVGAIKVGETHGFTLTKEIPTTEENNAGAKADIKLNIYAIQQANIDEYNENDKTRSAYHILTDKLTPKSYTREGNYIYFGSFPQTYAGTDATALGITDSTTDENGYYTATNGTKYAKIITSPYKTDGTYSYSNGTTITATGETAYFKVEPLKWRILKENADGTALIVCDNAIKAMAYQAAGTNNNYKESDLRTYLTGDFFTKTFNTGEKGIIKLTEVDNSAQTTDSDTNQYICENTNDYVFALSYKDMLNTDYGFENTTNQSLTRRFTNTDYSLATGGFMNINTGDFQYCGCPWLRSPNSLGSMGWLTWRIGGESSLMRANVTSTNGSVMPALNVML